MLSSSLRAGPGLVLNGLLSCALLIFCGCLTSCAAQQPIAFVDLIHLPRTISLRVGVPASAGVPAALLLGRLSEGAPLAQSRSDSFFVAAGSLRGGELRLDRAAFRIEEQSFAPAYRDEAAAPLDLRDWDSWRWFGREHISVSGLPAYCAADIASGGLQIFLLTADKSRRDAGYHAYVLLPDPSSGAPALQTERN